jgi:hypothetical protein
MSEAIGNDGLTDSERAGYARAYELGVGRRSLSDAELAMFRRWLSIKRPEWMDTVPRVEKP